MIDRVTRLECELASKNDHLRELVRRASALMACLETHGSIIVPHLLDTDDNPGQYLREAIEAAHRVLGDAA